MRNILLFIRRYFTFLLFLALMAYSLWLLYSYNKFYHAKGQNIAGEAVGWVNTRYNRLEDYFHMKDENKRLLKMNDSLINLTNNNFLRIDTNTKLVKDISIFDTANMYRHYIWREATVIFNTVNESKNYMQINRGTNQGIKDNMSVFSSNGALVGIIVNVGTNYSTVMSLLHIQSRVNVMIKRTKTAGTIQWDGKSPDYLTIVNVPKADSIKKGDTVLTGNFSLSYPPAKMIGTVAKILKDKSSTFYILKVKSAVKFSTIQQVMVVENLQYQEQKVLLEETKKKIEATQKLK